MKPNKNPENKAAPVAQKPAAPKTATPTTTPAEALAAQQGASAEAPPAQAEPAAVPAAPEELPAPKEGEGTLVSPEQVADEARSRQEMAACLPLRVQKRVLALKRPFPQEFAQLVEQLPAESRRRVEALVRRTRPEKQGVHSRNERFQPIDVKLYQGTGNDPLLPRDCRPGEFYSADGRIFKPPFDCAVVLTYEGRTLFPPKEDDQRFPLCTSLDRLHGSTYGDCATCLKAPSMQAEHGCTNETVIYFVDRALTGIYRMRFARSSAGYGKALLKVLRFFGDIYSRWIRVEAEQRNEEGKRWYVIKAAPAPEAGDVEDALLPLFDAISRTAELDAFYPALAFTYSRPSKSLPARAAEGETLDEAELAGGAPTRSQAGDFSAGV